MYCKQCGEKFEGTTCPSCGQVHQPMLTQNQNETSSVFLEEDERLLSQMSRGYLSNAILGGSLSTDYVLLSDRRVYYSGSFIGRVGQTFGKLTGQIILPLEKVTSINFIERKNIGLLIFAWMLFIGGLTIGFYGADDTDGMSFAAVIPAVVFIIAYYLNVTRYFVISSDSASIQINYRLYGKEAILKFVHDLGVTLTRHRAK